MLFANLKILFKIPLYILGDILYLLSYVIPKRKNLWVFGAWFGKRYSDNSRALFEYVNENHPEIEAVWLTSKNKVMKKVKSRGYKSCLLQCLLGTWLSLRAEAGIISTDVKDLHPFTWGRMKIIQLWHGSPLKKIMHDDNITFKEPSLIRRILFPFLNQRNLNQILAASSSSVRDILAGAFRIPQDRVKITGYPRNDIFYNPTGESLAIVDMINELRRAGKVGIYLPTHRREGDPAFNDFIISGLRQIDGQLHKHDTTLLIKHHHYHRNEKSNHGPNFKSVRFISDDDVNDDLYGLLPYTDFLITDYSSIYFDYLLLDKPIIFFPFDIDDYLKSDREFYYEYNEITPGPKAEDWLELVDKIEDSLKNPDIYNDKRAEIREMFNKYQDGGSSERVFNEIKKIVS